MGAATLQQYKILSILDSLIQGRGEFPGSRVASPTVLMSKYVKYVAVKLLLHLIYPHASWRDLQFKATPATGLHSAPADRTIYKDILEVHQEEDLLNPY